MSETCDEYKQGKLKQVVLGSEGDETVRDSRKKKCKRRRGSGVLRGSDSKETVERYHNLLHSVAPLRNDEGYEIRCVFIKTAKVM